MKTRSTIAILVSGMLLFTACVPSLPFISGDGEEEQVVVRPVQGIERPTVTVVRGSIIDAVRVLGRVVAESEEALFFKQNGRLKGIYVQYNQAVVAGTLLADLETGALETQIQNSELSLQDQERNLSKARTQAATGQADVTLAELAVDEAERALEKAQELLVEAQGGPTALERAQAQTAYTTAKSDHDAASKALEKAAQDLIAFQQGASVGLKAQRELALSNAEEAFRTAETRLEQLQSGNPDTQVLSQEANLRARQQALESANQAVNQEREDLIDQINKKIKSYRTDLSRKSDEIEDELDEVLDAIRQLGSRAPGARDAFEALLEALDEAQNNLRDAMQEEVDEPQRPRELEALLDQLNLMAIVDALELESDTAQTDSGETATEAEPAAPADPTEEGISGAEVARRALVIVQLGLLHTKDAGRSLSSTKSRLQAAQEKLDEYVELKTELDEDIEELNLQLVAPPSPGTHMAILWASREKARLDLQAAQLALDQGKAQASEATPAAQAELDRARFDLEQAREALANVEAELQLAYDTAEVAFLKAEAVLVDAEETWNTVQSGVVPDKLQDAEAEVARKEAALQKAQASLEQALINAADAGNVLKLENDLKRARANHELLLEQLADARLVAPFDGVIQFIKGKAGEPVSAYGEIIGLADPTKLIITADLSDDDSPKVALEQVADITLDAFSSEILKGTITKLPTSLVTTQGVIQDRSIRLEIDWPKEGAEIGMLARVTITVQHKDDVLKVPIESVKRSGRRTYVEYMDGDIKRAKNVETGIQTETEVEILSGLEEGFVILQGQ